MQRTTKLSLKVGADVPGKLSELAGSEEKAGEFLTELVRTLHQAQTASSNGVSLEEFAANSPNLILWHKEQQHLVHTLRQRLSQMSTNQATLLALIRLLEAAIDDLTNSSPDQRKH